FARQARYYALVILLSLVISFLYLHWDGRRRTLHALSAASLALLATHYLSYAGLALCLGVDYLLFGRHRKPFTRQDLVLLIASQVLVGGVIAVIYNPLAKPFVGEALDNWYNPFVIPVVRRQPDNWIVDRA